MDTDKKRKPFKKLRVLKEILNNTGADRIFMSFVAFVSKSSGVAPFLFSRMLSSSFWLILP